MGIEDSKLKDRIQKNFEHPIESSLRFSDCYIVLLMDDEIPDNNITALSKDGHILWNISDILKLNFPSAFIAIFKESETILSAITFNGLKYMIDVSSAQVIKIKITK